MNSNILKNKILEIFQESQSSPFLFVGSGFSRRYFDLPQWDELLKKFCENEDEFDELLSSANQNLPQVATLLAEKYHQRWWQNPENESKRHDFKIKFKGEKLKNRTSALRMELSEYINGLAHANEYNLENEINALKQVNIDGIITTNWDGLLENLFPDHEVFVGQEDLLFSNTHAVGEIYKIHGCASDHNSLILTSEDYENFHKLNPYLAAKLITIFVEHPIVFIGYSMKDENIISLLASIVEVLDQEKLSKLSKNLIFLQRSKGKESTVTKHTLQFGSRTIPTTVVISDDYTPMYLAISEVEKKIPVRLLRMYKQQFYEIVGSTEPSKRMHVVNESDISKGKKIEFVVGLSVASEATSKVGYKGLKLVDLFIDLLNDRSLSSDLILNDTIPSFSKSTTYIPIFKYLKDLNISSKKNVLLSHPCLAGRLPKAGAKFYQSKGYVARFTRDAKNLSCTQIIEMFTPSLAAYFLPFVSDKNLDLSILENFLKANIEQLKESSARSTPFRKLACFYDWKKNGTAVSF